MPRPTDVQARPDFRLWICFDDGTEGEVDLSGLAGRGVFEAWNDRAFFESVRLTPHGAIAWSDQLELCPDAMYLQLTGKSSGSVFPGLSHAEVDAGD